MSSTETTQPQSRSAGASRFAKFFGNIKVRSKVLAGFASVLAILIAVSGLGYSNFVFVGEEIDILAEDIENVALITRIEVEFLKLKGHAREFANKGVEADAEKVAEIAVKITPAIEEALARIGAPALNAKIVEIGEEFEIYIKDFEIAKDLKHEFNNLIKEELEPNGEAIIEDLEAVLDEVVAEGNTEAIIYAGVAMEHALLAQLYTNILIGRQDDSFADKVEYEFAEFTAALESLGTVAQTEKERVLLADVQERFLAYETAFEKVREDDLALRELIDGEMKAAAETIARNAEWVEAEISKDEEKVRAEAIATIETAELEMIIAGLVGVVVGITLAWLIGNGIAGPIGKMTVVMGRLADGDTSVEIEGADRSDEIGEMAGAVQVFKDNAIEKDRLEAEQVEEQAKRDERAQTMDRLTKDFDSSVAESLETVTSAAVEMQSTAESLTSSSEETSRQSQAAAAASEQASANVQTVSAAAEEMSSSINEIARQVAQSATMAKTAVEEAQKTNETVQGLAESSQKIGEVVDIISDIASQTNLLALNATIEAARAGDAGKGFAVVASEVKSLATQTAKATDEIASQIAAIQTATDDAVGAIKGIGEKIAEMDEVTTAIASAIEEQGAATGEISSNSQQAAAGTQEVSENIASVSQAAAESGTAAGQVLQTAGELSKQAELLRGEVDKFLAEVRAA